MCLYVCLEALGDRVTDVKISHLLCHPVDNAE